MKSFYLILLLGLSILMFSFSEGYNCRRSGIRGQVLLESGNRMPSPEEPLPAARGIKTNLYIYELTNISDVKREGGSAFYHAINTKLVKTVRSNDRGLFKVKLKPGRYSIFIKKDDMFYSSQFDEKNNIHPVEVVPGKMTEAVFKANYGAVY